MHILVCYKIVPEEQDIIINEDRTLSFERAELKLGQYDLNAVEAGALLAESAGVKLSSLTVGADEVTNSKMQKSVLSRGPQSNYALSDSSLSGADCNATARALALTVEKIGEWDLIICGEGSSDLYSQQVGVQLGEMLNVPALNAVSAITLEDGKLIVERTLENEVETLSVPLPAVLSVTSDINVTRIPSMRDILGAGKKPSTIFGGADVGLTQDKTEEMLQTLAPGQTDRKCVLVEGDSDDNISTFLQHIRAELG